MTDVLAPEPIIKKVAKKVEQEKQAKKIAAASRDSRPSPEVELDPQAIELAAKLARDAESKAWRLLVLRLATLRGNEEAARLIGEKHPELVQIPEICGASAQRETTIEKAKEVARGWFVRGLRGSNRQGPGERQRMCDKLSEALERIIQPYWNGTLDQVANALASGSAEEGPFVCALLRKELVHSDYANIWISKAKNGIYLIGDEDDPNLPTHDQDGATIQKPVKVKVSVSKGRLLIDGFFNEADDGEMTPAKVAVGPFLSVYFEGAPLKEAMSRWKDGNYGRLISRGSDSGEEEGGRIGGVRPKAAARSKAATVVGGFNGLDGKVAAMASTSDAARAISAELPPLPPGWELRESRSKKGVFYYANEAKGLSQLERPKA